jgi:PRTRC genetic system protein A
MIVSHIFAKTTDLGPISEGDLYQYVVAANGIFLRAERPGLKAMIWVASISEPIRGLVELSSYVHLTESRVPARVTARMVEMAYHSKGKEILFYLEPLPWTWITADTKADQVFVQPANPWRLRVPEQFATSATVRPVDPGDGEDALIELHSHHAMAPFFSSMDNRDETGFRVYAVVGNLRSMPMINVRLGIYGHFSGVPANTVFDLPVGLVDAFMLGSTYGDDR